MADISSTFTEVESSLGRPTLALLTRKNAPAVLAVLSTAFAGKPVAADLFLVTVDNQLHALQEAGLSDLVASNTVRSIINSWVSEKWLDYDTTADGGEQYSLTSHSLTALDHVGRAGRSRAMVSQSRIRSILEAARECAEAANPDKAVRIAWLDNQIENLTAERDRLLAGGELSRSTDDEVIEAYLNLKELLDQLPADFRRVIEAVESEQRRILTDFQSESVSAGVVVSDYLDRAAEALAQTPEGRAFQGAQELLRDTSLMDQLRRDVDATLNHAISETLDLAERKALRATPLLMETNVGAVLSKRHQNTRTIQQYVTRNASGSDKEVDALVTRLKKELLTWQPARRNENVPAAIHIAQTDIGHLQQRYYDPTDHLPPPPLEERMAIDDAPRLSDLLSQGGPRLTELKLVLLEALTARDSVTAAEAFNASSDELRRPVEVIGYLQLGERLGPVDPEGPVDRYDAVRPDGTTRTFSAPRVVFTQEDLETLDVRQGVSHE